METSAFCRCRENPNNQFIDCDPSGDLLSSSQYPVCHNNYTNCDYLSDCCVCWHSFLPSGLKLSLHLIIIYKICYLLFVISPAYRIGFVSYLIGIPFIYNFEIFLSFSIHHTKLTHINKRMLLSNIRIWL